MTETNSTSNEIQQRVIIIEDDYTVRDIISDFLEDEGYNFLSFDSTEKAREIIKSTDILIVDVRIETNPSAGVDFVISLRNNNYQFSTTKTIFISNFGKSPEIEQKLQQIGKDGREYIWIGKPLEMSELANAISQE